MIILWNALFTNKPLGAAFSVGTGVERQYNAVGSQLKSVSVKPSVRHDKTVNNGWLAITRVIGNKTQSRIYGSRYSETLHGSCEQRHWLWNSFYIRRVRHIMVVVKKAQEHTCRIGFAAIETQPLFLSFPTAGLFFVTPTAWNSPKH